jgi:hypothetical protein
MEYNNTRNQGNYTPYSPYGSYPPSNSGFPPSSSGTQTAPVKKFKMPLILISIIVSVLVVLFIAISFSGNSPNTRPLPPDHSEPPPYIPPEPAPPDLPPVPPFKKPEKLPSLSERIKDISYTYSLRKLMEEITWDPEIFKASIEEVNDAFKTLI